MFSWNNECQNGINVLRDALVKTPILISLNFTKPFILDVDWSTKGTGAIVSQHVSRNEQVITYATKGLTPYRGNFTQWKVNVMLSFGV